MKMVFDVLPKSKIDLPPMWLSKLEQEFDQPYMRDLRAFLLAQKQAGNVIYPPGKQIFNAFNSTDFNQVRVVVLGQDPYHGPGQAHGLSFSVPSGIKIPPSLVNIYKELHSDLGIPIPAHGCLSSWAQQGVLLLNATLTVAAGNAGSHQKQGWERFTDTVIHRLNEGREKLVFLLWGSYAIKKGSMIDRSKHLVLTAPHPSPLSAHRGFLGCRHFSQTNTYLAANGLPEIDWAL